MIDSHAHLTNNCFEKNEFSFIDMENDEYIVQRGNRDQLIRRMKESGIMVSIEPAIDFDSNTKILRLCDMYPKFILPAMGIHPARYIGLGYDNKGAKAPGLCNGMIPGGKEYSGYIDFTLITENISYQITKTVSKDGVNYFKKIEASNGDEVFLKTEFENLGSKDLTNVGFHDVNDGGIILINNSTVIAHNDVHNTKMALSDLIDKSGYNTGTYGQGSKAIITYKARIAENYYKKELCTKSFVNHDFGELWDDAIICVKK